MNGEGEDKDRSAMTDWFKEQPPDFCREPPIVAAKTGECGIDYHLEEDNRSVMTYRSKEEPPDFSKEPRPPGTKVGEVQAPVNSEEEEKRVGEIQVPVKSEEEEIREGMWRERHTFVIPADSWQEKLDVYKRHLRSQYHHVREGTAETPRETPFRAIYTELYVTEGQSESFNSQHEMTLLDRASKMNTACDTPIRCQDIFKSLPGERNHFRVVLTNGVAGIGKTFLVQKFTLDWAEGHENQEFSLLVLLSFRELNLIKGEQCSLLNVIHILNPTLRSVTAEKLTACKVLLILDGLDENRIPLDFQSTHAVCDADQISSVGELLTNLIKGHLLPSALLWITSRPAASHQIPQRKVNRVTEVRGFTDTQKEEYFRRKIIDEGLSEKVFAHIKSSRSLHIMCQIPVFCWIAATVLEHISSMEQIGELPKTMTDMYTHFLMVLSKKKMQKYTAGEEGTTQALLKADPGLLKLGRLAFEQLEKMNIMFYQEDLEECGLEVAEVSVFSGICTEIFTEERGILQKKVYCFVHMSIQEFLAAVYFLHSYTHGDTEVLDKLLGGSSWHKDGESCWSHDDEDDDNDDIDDGDGNDDDDDDDDDNDKVYENMLALPGLLCEVLEKALDSKTGHLDLFVRFLHGLCLQSNQMLLQGLCFRTKTYLEITQSIIYNLRGMEARFKCPDRSINIFHCLLEMKDQSVYRQVKAFLTSQTAPEGGLSEIHCSALAYILTMSEEIVDEFDPGKYHTSDQGRLRLISVVRNCRRAKIAGLWLSDSHFEVVASALKSSTSYLTELDLQGTKLLESGEALLCPGLESPNCKLCILRLANCGLSERCCASLANNLRFDPSYLRELDLSSNHIEDSGVLLLSEGLQSPHCRLEDLRLSRCTLSQCCCSSLAYAMTCDHSRLRKLDLSRNDLQDMGVMQLCSGLDSPHCGLTNLTLQHCELSANSCASLAASLMSKSSCLRELDLSYNGLTDSGIQLLSCSLRTPYCRLSTLSLVCCLITNEGHSSLVSALRSSHSHLKDLNLAHNNFNNYGNQMLSADQGTQ